MRRLALSAIAFFFVAAPIYMSESHPVFINGKPFGNALTINGVLAVSLDDLRNNLGGGTLTVRGNTVTVARDAASGLPTGKRMHKPFVITKEYDRATPILFSAGKQYISLNELAKLFGGQYTGPTTVQRGQSIHLNFAPNPNAVFAGDVNG